MTNEKTTERISLRVTEALFERLEAEATAQNRPLANYIKAILIEHVETLDRAKKIAERK